MTAPQQPPAQPAVSPHTITIPSNVSILRAVISVCETAGFITAATLAAMNNGSDFRNAVVTAFVAFVMHGVNHNAGGSPI